MQPREEPRRDVRRRRRVGLPEVEPRVDADLVAAGFSQHPPVAATDRTWERQPGVVHPLLEGDVAGGVGLGLPQEELLDRPPPAVGVDLPHAALLAARRDRRVGGDHAQVVGVGDLLRHGAVHRSAA